MKRAILGLLAAIGALTVCIALLVFVLARPVSGQQLTLDQLKQIQARNERALLAIPGVQGVGLGSEGGTPVLHVFAFEASARALIPLAVESLPVRIFVASRFQPLSQSDHTAQYSTPVPLGISTSSPYDCGIGSGTLGFQVKSVGSPSVYGYVTNNHIAARGSNGCPNNSGQTAQYHRALGDAGCALTTQIGTLSSFVPIKYNWPNQNRVDAAFVASTDLLVSNTILDLGVPSTHPREPDTVLGASVVKSGRTTGVTTSTINTINATVVVHYNNDTCGGQAEFVGQLITGNFSQGGDSGSPVLMNDGSMDPVGLLFAGSTADAILNPITYVLSDLGVEFVSANSCPGPGRWKGDGSGGCYWDACDSGANQCSPPAGRWKSDGNGGCYWDPNDSGPDQCTPEHALATVGQELFSTLVVRRPSATLTRIRPSHRRDRALAF